MRRLVVYDTMAVAKLSYYNTVAGYIRTKRWIQLDCKGSTIKCGNQMYTIWESAKYCNNRIGQNKLHFRWLSTLNVSIEQGQRWSKVLRVGAINLSSTIMIGHRTRVSYSGNSEICNNNSHSRTLNLYRAYEYTIGNDHKLGEYWAWTSP